MNTRHLEYVVVAAEQGSFTRAAQLLHVAQPSLSAAVAAMEQRVGATLFERTGRRLTLTPAGASFVAAARQVLRDVDVLQSAVAEAEGEVAGRLELAVSPSVTADLVPGVLARLRAQHPAVTVRVETTDAPLVADRVRQGQAELGISEEPAHHGLRCEPIGTLTYLAVCPPGTPRRRSFRFRDLAQLPLIEQLGSHTIEAEEARVRDPHWAPGAIQIGCRESIVPLVLAGAGVAFLPEGLARSAERLGAVVAPTTPPVRRTLHILCRVAPLSPAADAFVELLQRAIIDAALASRHRQPSHGPREVSREP